MIDGKTLGVDATTLEANAALRSIVRRDTGESYESYGCRSYIYNGVNNLQAHYRWYVTDCF